MVPHDRSGLPNTAAFPLWRFQLPNANKWIVYNGDPIKMDDFGATPISGNLMKPPYLGSRSIRWCYLIGFLKTTQYPGIAGMAPSFRTKMDFQLSPQIIQN